MKISPDHNQDNWNDIIQFDLSEIETMPLNDKTDSIYPDDAGDKLNQRNSLHHGIPAASHKNMNRVETTNQLLSI